MPFIDVFSYEWCQKCRTFVILLYGLFQKWKMKGIVRRKFPHYSILSIEKRVREGEIRRVSAFFIILQFLTLSPSLQDWDQNVEREKEETVIKFSKGSLCPKFLHLSMHLSVSYCDVECSRIGCQTMSLSEDNLKKVIVVHSFRKNKM